MDYKKKYKEIVEALTAIVNDSKKQDEQKHIECINFTNEFENQVSHLIALVLNGEYEYNKGFIKYAAQSLLEYAKKECINYTIQSFVEHVKKDQKPTDKVGPKFKVGDWVVYECGEITQTLQIKEIIEKIYVFSDGSTLDVDEDNLHLWTINDAKEGDVLCIYDCGKPNILLKLKEQANKHNELNYYFYYNIEMPYIHGKTGCFYPVVENVRPATNEQRKLLLMQMHCAGYEWYGDLKELYKLNKQLKKDHLTL